MAVIAQNDPNDPNKKTDNTIGGSQNSLITDQQAQPQTQTKQAGSGRFQNLQKFIQANQGGGERLGQQIGSNIQKQGEQARTGIGGELGRIQNLRQQQMDQFDQDRGFIQQATNDPTKTVSNQQDFQRFQQLQTLPQNFQAPQFQQQPYQQQIGKLGETTGLTQTEQGRFGLLRQQFGLPGYSTGAARLDQLLLQTDPTQIRELGNIGRQEQQTTEQRLQGALGEAETIGGELKTEAEKLAQLTGTSVADAENALRAELQTRAETASELPSLRESLKSGTISQEQANRLGIGSGGELYGLSQADIDEILKSADVNQSTVATQEDLSRAKALGQLSGMGQNVIQDIGRVGEYGSDKETAISNFAKRLAEQRSSYENAAANRRSAEEFIQSYNPVIDKSKAASDAVRRYQDLKASSYNVSVSPKELEQARLAAEEAQRQAIEAYGTVDPYSAGGWTGGLFAPQDYDWRTQRLRDLQSQRSSELPDLSKYLNRVNIG